MEHHSFLEGTLPEGYLPEFEESLFNRRLHRTLQAESGWRSFYVIQSRLKKIRGAVHFHVSGEKAVSPLRSPFGSFEFVGAMPTRVLYDFVTYVEEQLRQSGVRTVIITSYPQCYFPDQASLLETFLINQGYFVSAHPGSFIEIASESVEKRFNNSTRYNLRRARREGLRFEKLSNERSRVVYDFLEEHQRQKGYALSMSFDLFRRSLDTFPAAYNLFGMFSEQSLVAGAITVRVNTNILYNYVHSHDRQFDHLSPVVALVAGICDYCRSEQIRLLDMGTSAVNGQPDFDLLYFKRSLGARATTKLTFEKRW